MTSSCTQMHSYVLEVELELTPHVLASTTSHKKPCLPNLHMCLLFPCPYVLPLTAILYLLNSFLQTFQDSVKFYFSEKPSLKASQAVMVPLCISCVPLGETLLNYCNYLLLVSTTRNFCEGVSLKPRTGLTQR